MKKKSKPVSPCLVVDRLGRGMLFKVFERREIVKLWSKWQKFGKGAGKAITGIKYYMVLVSS